MSILDAAASAIGETVACLAGRVAGHAFNLEPERAQRLGEYIVIGLIAGAGALVTFLYS